MTPEAAVRAARGVEAAIAALAAARDAEPVFPADEMALLGGAGLLAAPLPPAFGGCGLGVLPGTAGAARAVLTAVGRASLAVGRLFEGHVNAVKLCWRFGGEGALAIVAAEVAAGRVSGVWNAERGDGPVAERVGRGWRLTGRKVHCSGAGGVRRPLVTAATPEGPVMFLPDMGTAGEAAAGVAIDLSVWRPAGMKASMTGTAVFDGLGVGDAARVGGPGDYYHAPLFAGGAWRVLAVQLGALDALQALHAGRLGARAEDPLWAARFAQAAGAHEAARLLVAEAARRAEGAAALDADDPGAAAAWAAACAYVDLARGAFEEFALAVLAHVRRAAGLGGCIAPDPVDRVARDLETYLRQPFLDASRANAAAHLIAAGGRVEA